MGKRKKPSPVPAKQHGALRPVHDTLLEDVRQLIASAREATAQAVNSALVLLYWQVGRRISSEVLQEQRAGYGEEILSTLSKELVAEYGQGFSVPNLSRMTRFAELFPDPEIVATLSKQLGWSHFVEILPMKEPMKR